MVVFSEVQARLAPATSMLMPGWTMADRVMSLHSIIQKHSSSLSEVSVSSSKDDIIVAGGWDEVSLVYDLLKGFPLLKPFPNLQHHSNLTLPPAGSLGEPPETAGNSDADTQVYIKKELLTDNEEEPLDDDNHDQDLTDVNIPDISLDTEGDEPFKCEPTDLIKSTSSDEDIGDNVNLSSGNVESLLSLEAKCGVEEYRKYAKNVAMGESGTFKCLLCKKQTKTLRRLRVHIRTVHLSKPFQCDICSKKVSTKETLRQHVRQQHGVKCTHCDASFTKKSDSVAHMKARHLEAYIESLRKTPSASKPGEHCCPVCLHVTDDHDGLLSHFREKHVDAPPEDGGRGRCIIKCPVCDFTGKDGRGVRDHMHRVHLEKKLQCPKCDRRFGLEKDLRFHLATHTASLICEHCGKSFTTKGGLTLHVQVQHEDRKPWWYGNPEGKKLCGICGVMVRGNHDLQDHINQHNNVKQYQCDQCSMGFYTKANLRSHKVTHEVVGKYVCDLCDKTFKRRGALNTHRRIHSEAGRVYKCETCAKRFTQVSSLKRHARIHTGDKPYPCRLCGAAFSDYSILRRHLMGVHKSNDRKLLRKAGADEWDKDGGSRRGRPPGSTSIRKAVAESGADTVGGQHTAVSSLSAADKTSDS